MTETAIVAIKTVIVDLPEGLARIFPVVQELRKNLELDDFTRFAMLAHTADGYRLVAREERGRVLAVMGYRILHDLAHGSHLYIDDLVVTQSERSKGHGAELLKFAEAEARRLGLSGLRLCAAADNKEAQEFYRREGWDARSIAFKKKVPNH